MRTGSDKEVICNLTLRKEERDTGGERELNCWILRAKLLDIEN